ncbi:MAG: hypothetical protein ACQKBU_01665 [Verrucomicrobiales bacterium]
MRTLRGIYRSISAILMVVACLLLVAATTLAFRSAPGGVASAGLGWGRLFEVVATDHGVQESEALYDFSEPPEGLEEEEVAELFGISNRFMVCSALQIMVGLVALGLMFSAIAQRRSGRWIWLSLGGVVAVVLLGFFLFGFSLAYPGEFSMGGLVSAELPAPVLSSMGEFADPYDYGLPFTLWTDFLYQSLYAILAAALVMSLAAGQFRVPTLMLIASAVGVFGFPLVTSWLWGGGWLHGLGAYDFAGSAMLHLLAGGAAFALVFLARILPPASPGFAAPTGAGRVKRKPLRLTRGSLGLYVIGAVWFVALIFGVNAGSVLAWDVPVVAAVIRATAGAMLGGAAVALVIGQYFAGRPVIMVTIAGGLAGWAAVSACADSCSFVHGLAVGSVAGAGGAMMLGMLDRFGFDDPFGVLAVSLVGGGVGMMAAGILVHDTNLFVQMLATTAVTSVGVALGGSLGLCAWLARVLCEAPEVVLPVEQDAVLAELREIEGREHCD